MNPTLQALIQAAGGSPSAIVAQFFDQAIIRTNITPDIVIPLGPNSAPPSPAMRQLLDSVQPTVVLSGPAGTVPLAPYGQAQGGTSWLPLALGGLAVAGFIGWAVFGD